MNIPAEFSGRVYKTRINGIIANFKKLDQIRKEWQGSEIDVIYENNSPVVVVVFETQEDCLAFTIKYGKKYA